MKSSSPRKAAVPAVPQNVNEPIVKLKNADQMKNTMQIGVTAEIMLPKKTWLRGFNPPTGGILTSYTIYTPDNGSQSAKKADSPQSIRLVFIPHYAQMLDHVNRQSAVPLPMYAVTNFTLFFLERFQQANYNPHDICGLMYQEIRDTEVLLPLGIQKVHQACGLFGTLRTWSWMVERSANSLIPIQVRSALNGKGKIENLTIRSHWGVPV